MELHAGKKITIFTSDGKRLNHRPLYEAVLETMIETGIRDATVRRGIAGFGASRTISDSRIEVLSYNLPITIEATGDVEQVDKVAAIIATMLDGGLIDVMPVQIVRAK